MSDTAPAFIPVDDHHRHAIIAIEQHDDFPVLIHRVGFYPHVATPDGAKVEKLIVVSVGGGSHTVSVQAGYDDHGRQMTLRVGSADSLDAARLLYPAAVKAIHEAPALYAEAKRLAGLLAYQGPLSRSDYESLAAEWGVKPLADSEVYEGGDFSFPQYPLGDLPALWIHQRRALGVKAEAEQLAKDRAIKRAQTIADLRDAPIVSTYSMFVAAGYPAETLQRGALYTVISRTDRRRITDDDPAIFGSHLLGHEGEQGETITVTVRQR